jgi:hypothetical protein
MVRVFHKVKHCTNSVKCLANAFDNCVNVDFGRLTEQFGRRGGDYHEVEYFTKAKPTQKRLLMCFTQKRVISTKPSNTHPPYGHFHTMPTQPCVIFIKGDHE